jgi:hypothetical protein
VSRVREILSRYGSDNPGTLTNLTRMLNHGRLAGSGKMVILPVDQGFEHGPARSFAPNPPAYAPHYHYRLAIKSGCNAYAAQRGAHGIKVKIPSEHIEQEAARKVYEECKIPVHSLTERIRHVVQSYCNGRRVFIFSGARSQGMPKCLTRSGRFVTVAALARLLDAIPSHAQSPTH